MKPTKQKIKNKITLRKHSQERRPTLSAFSFCSSNPRLEFGETVKYKILLLSRTHFLPHPHTLLSHSQCSLLPISVSLVLSLHLPLSLSGTTVSFSYSLSHTLPLSTLIMLPSHTGTQNIGQDYTGAISASRTENVCTSVCKWCKTGITERDRKRGDENFESETNVAGVCVLEANCHPSPPRPWRFLRDAADKELRLLSGRNAHVLSLATTTISSSSFYDVHRVDFIAPSYLVQPSIE